MKVVSFYEKSTNPVVLCLGGFDSIHSGHKKLIELANEIKKEYNASSSVFTFINDFGYLSGKQGEQVFSYEERLERLKKNNVDEVCYVEFNKEFSTLSPEEFFVKLLDNRAIAALICGKDFTFGYKAKGNCDTLISLCNKYKVPVLVCDFKLDEFGEKVSTSRIKECLLRGDIAGANALLGDEYFVFGKVEEGRRVGRKLGFPTANVVINKSKLQIKPAVYSGYTIIDGVKFKCIINLGNAPTFNQDKYLLECYVDGFNGDLYGRNLTVFFSGFIREIKKFASVEQLTEQLNKDVKVIR